MPKCKFTTRYYNYELHKWDDFYCDEEEPLASGFCIFHDKDYLLQEKTNYEEHKRKVLDRLRIIVNLAISKPKALRCIGFQLPEFILSDLSTSKEFAKPVYFSGSQFFGKVDFSGANFKGVASFSLAKFQEGPADFSHVHFKQTDFFSAHFRDRADFSHAEFQEGLADFFSANFKGVAVFHTAHFNGEAEFSFANFNGSAYFNKANFKGEADFKEANFNGSAYFKEANFKVRANFSRANFQEGARFFETSFEEAYFSTTEFKGFTNFQYVNFGDEDKILFDRIDLSNVSFNYTDISRIRFGGNVEWGGKKAKEDRFKIIDERLLEEKFKRKKTNEKKNIKPSIENEPIGESKMKPEQQLKVEPEPEPQSTISLTEDDEIEDTDEEVTVEQEEQIEEVQQYEEKRGDTTKDINLGSIIGIYRDLKENYEKRHRYEYAAKFHIREMELQRNYREVQSEEEPDKPVIKENNWFRRNLFSLTGWYYNLSRYGEDYTRPLLLALSILLFSTIYWSMQTDPTTLPPKYAGLSQLGNLTHMQKAFERSLASFYQTTYDDKFVLEDYLIRTISVIFIGILFVEAIRRRVRS